VTGVAALAGRLGVAGAILLVPGPGCGTEDVVVAEVHVGRPCSPASPCPAGEYCYTETCSATDGTCQLPPTSCADTAENPVCDCYGVFYWNDCTRAMHSVPATASCTAMRPLQCKSQSDCTLGSGAVCGQLTPSCDSDKIAPGLCWILPAACPQDSTGLGFVSCSGDAAQTCATSLCSALETQEPFRVVFASACP